MEKFVDRLHRCNLEVKMTLVLVWTNCYLRHYSNCHDVLHGHSDHLNYPSWQNRRKILALSFALWKFAETRRQRCSRYGRGEEGARSVPGAPVILPDLNPNGYRIQ